MPRHLSSPNWTSGLAKKSQSTLVAPGSSLTAAVIHRAGDSKLLACKLHVTLSTSDLLGPEQTLGGEPPLCMLLLPQRNVPRSGDQLVLYSLGQCTFITC